MEESGFNRFCVACEAVRTFTGKLEKIRRLSDYLRSLGRSRASVGSRLVDWTRPLRNPIAAL